ncbi:MAG: hypothetical protein EAX81_00720 [Candidatus Thorarchaeota archaeon]|nr:hypothetical protein [Candidatus Thorarchaeota archaeon]
MVYPEEDPEHFVRTFAPILHFHPKEGNYCCFPSDAEAVFERHSKDWSGFGKTLQPKKLQQDTPCYYEIWDGPDMTQMKFWFWYNYNKFPKAPLGLGQHIGDWEHIEVRHYPLGSKTPGTIWLVSNHLKAILGSHPGHFILQGFMPQPVTLADLHIHVWVALGSHASYLSPDDKTRRFLGFWRDETEDGGPIWETEENLKGLGDTNFGRFEGRWGNKRSPRSPRNPYNCRERNAPLLKPTPVNENQNGLSS